MLVGRQVAVVGLVFALLQTSVAFGGPRPTGATNDPLAIKERADVTWGGIQCAVNTAVLALSGGTVAAALTPDVSALIFSIVREEIEANPADFALPGPVGRLESAFNRLVTKISQNPGIIAQTAMITLMANAPGGPPGGGLLKLFSQVAVIRTLAECGITIYRGVVQLAKDIPGLVTDLQGWHASSVALKKMCRDHKGFVMCNRVCYGTQEVLGKWMPRCERDSAEWERNVDEVIHGAATYCMQAFCKSKKMEPRILEFKQCRLLAEDHTALVNLTSNTCR